MSGFNTLFVNALSGKTETILIKPDALISELRQLIEKRTGIDSERQILKFATFLCDERNGKSMTLKDYGIGDHSTIEVMVGLEGGDGTSVLKIPGMALVKCADITSEDKFKTIKFSKYAPAWRFVVPGLNFEGVCKNEGCVACKKNVWMQKGFFEPTKGLCDFSYEMNNLECPMCSIKIEEDAVNGFGYYNCKLRVECLPTGREKIDFEVESRDDFKCACGSGDDEKISYKYIRLTVNPL